MSETESRDIAVIGMAGRFPGARDINEFWGNLVGGVESITFFSEDELREAGVAEKHLADPNYVRAAPITHGAEDFDAGYFGMTIREAEILDPQHRVFLEVCDGALQYAGYDHVSFPGRVGVYGGTGFNTYLTDNVNHHPDVVQMMGALATNIANLADYLTTGVSYRLGLRGPSFTCLSACSTSLVAVHLACQALMNEECELAIAGGVEEFVPRVAGYLYSEGGIYSPDGHCRTFDAKARGTVFGSGAGAVLLKPLPAALAEGDNVLAVIRGSAINNDGADKGAFTAPSVSGQLAVVSEALRLSAVDPDTISYVEAHGTSTLVGDPTEVAALTQAYQAYTDRKQYCGIGSVKTNVGHLGAAAGVTGLIKTVLAMQQRVLPPNINFDEPNPQIDFDNSPFYVNAELTPWKSDNGPLRASVSSFGVGGTNAHLVLEEAPPAPAPAPPQRSPQLLLLSARTPTALTTSANDLGSYLRERPAELADAAYTLAVGRQVRSVRSFLVAEEAGTAADQLAAGVPLPTAGVAPGRGVAREVAFLFPGQGAQYVQMGRDLYRDEPLFRDEVDACARVLASHTGWDLRDLLYPADGADEAAATEQLTRTAVTQPALFVVEYAMARLLQSWGVQPAIMAGHSIGEYVAACLAGVFSRDDALALVAARGALMQEQPAGSMIAVPLSEELLTPLITDDLDLAAVNAPDLCVVSGPDGAVGALRELLSVQGVDGQVLHTSHAFHSRMMDPILERFGELVAAVPRHAPTVPFVSNLTGALITEEQATDPGYWTTHLRRAVRFGDAVPVLSAGASRAMVEVGPGQTLTGLARRQLERDQHGLALSTMRHLKQRQSDVSTLLAAVGQLWQAGGGIDVRQLWAGEPRRRRSLPPVPHEPQRCWLEPRPETQQQQQRDAEVDETGPYYLPTWREAAPLPVAEVDTAAAWVVFTARGDGPGTALAARLAAAGARVTTVYPGDEHVVAADGTITVRPREAADYNAVVSEAMGTDASRIKVVHGWLVGDLPGQTTQERYQIGLDQGFYSILSIVQAVSRNASAPPMDLYLLTSEMHDITGHERIEPVKASVYGFVRLVPKEVSQATCRSVDVAGGPADAVAGQLLREICGPGDEWLTAYRGRKRWVWSYEELAPTHTGLADDLLRDRGVYLITGGLGAIGLITAKDLATHHSARIALLGRNGLPPREEWASYLAGHGADDPKSAQIRAVQEVEEAGGEVLVCAADVTDPAALRAVRQQVEQTFGPVEGIFHAAGVTAGGMLETRAFEDAEQVLAPKVFGTLALEEAFGDTIRLLVLYSSFTVYSGDFGLGDYCSANAIMDAYAHTKRDDSPYVVSINWSIWKRVGMANAELPEALTVEIEDREEPVPHPLLGTRRDRSGDDRIVFHTTLTPELWVTDEHRLEGVPTMPGTSLVEMMRAAYQEVTGERTAELREVVFMLPLSFNHSREVHTVLDPRGDGFYDVLIRDAADTGGAPAEFAKAKAGPGPSDPAPVHDLAQWRDHCRTENVPEQTKSEHGMITLGVHWSSARRHWSSDPDDAGIMQELVEIELAAELQDDLDEFVLHPASFDLATALGQTVVATQTRHLPFGYDRIVVRAPLPARLFSYFEHRDDTRGALIRTDCTLVDGEGVELVAVKGFTMFEYSDQTMRAPEAAGDAASLASQLDGPRPDSAEQSGGGNYTAAQELEGVLLRSSNREFGIGAEEGYPILRGILNGDLRPQVIICPDSFAKRLRLASEVNRDSLSEQMTAAAPARTSSVSPRNLLTPYAEPESDIQRILCGMWANTLAVDSIGIDDDFFDVNGNSLIAVQLVAQIREQFQVDLAVATLFETRTVRALADVIEGQIVDMLAGLSEDEAAARLASISNRE